MDYLITSEKEMLELLLKVREFMTGPQIYKKIYYDTITDVRDMIKRLENKRFGCPTGLHSSNCFCSIDKPGFATETFKRRLNSPKLAPNNKDSSTE